MLDHLDHLDHSGLRAGFTAPIEFQCAPVDRPIGLPETATIEKRTRKPRQYTGRFGGFCSVCGAWFPAKTSKKKTCNEACKSRLKRQRKKVREAEEQVLWTIGDIQRLLDTSDKVQRRKAKEALLHIYEQARATCEEVGIKCQP